MNWYLIVLKKYAVFSGRASRSEYWFFVLFNFIFATILNIIGRTTMQSVALTLIYDLVVLIPAIAVAVRRMHDIDKSGWFILIPIYNLILACTPGTSGPNRYGSDPLRPEYDEFLEQPTNP